MKMNNQSTLRQTKYLVSALTLLGLLWSANAFASPTSPQRIVSVGGALTEILYALGAEKMLVGVDTTSSWPESAKELPQVGYQRSLSAEGVLSLRPDLVLATDNAGPAEVLTQLRATGLDIKVFPADFTVNGVVERVRTIAKLVGREKEGEELIENILTEAASAKLLTAQTQPKPRVLFLLAMGSGSPLASGKNTAADAMIHLAGGENVLSQFNGYKPVSSEAIIAARPDFLLLVSHGKGDVTSRTQQVLSLPGMQHTAAAKEGNVIHMDGLKLLGFGPRIGSAIADLSRQLNSVHAP